jgi:hypothetical protein
MKGLTRFTVLRELLLHTGRRGTGIKEGKTHQGQYLFYVGLRSQRHRLPRTFQIHYKDNSPGTLAYIRRQMKEQFIQAFQEYWAKNMPKRYAELEIPLQRPLLEMKLPRFTLGKLYAARLGHGDFADYHARLNHEDAECHCQCGALKSLEQFYYCRLARHAAAQRRRPAYNLREMLAILQGAQEVHNWLNKIAFYKDICPMRRCPAGEALALNSSHLLPSLLLPLPRSPTTLPLQL